VCGKSCSRVFRLFERLGRVLLNWETKTKRNTTKRNTTKRNETKWSITKRNEIQRNETKNEETKRNTTKRNEIYQTKHKRSKNNQWRGKNQWDIEWLVRLIIDLSLDAFLLQNSKSSTKVMHHYSKFILNSLKHRVSFRRRPASKGLLNVRKWTSKLGLKELVLLKCWYK
jgi:hypothetical protein